MSTGSGLVQGAVLDLSTSVRDGRTTIDRAMYMLELVSENLLTHVHELDDQTNTIMQVDSAAAQVRTSIARAVDALYEAVTEVKSIR